MTIRKSRESDSDFAALGKSREIYNNQCWNSNQNSNLLLPWKKPVCKVDRNKHIRLHYM